MKREELVLLYHFDDDAKRTALQEVLRKLGIRTKLLPDNAWKDKLGWLLGVRGFKETPLPEEQFSFPYEVMVMQNLSRKRLDAVLKAMHDANIPPIPYKAVVTPFNILWSFRRLCETMRKEHGYMAAREQEKAQEGK